MARRLGLLFALGMGLSTCAALVQANDSFNLPFLQRLDQLTSLWKRRTITVPRYSPQDVSLTERNLLDKRGYDPGGAGSEGKQACSGFPRSSQEENYQNLIRFGDYAAAVLKAQQLVWMTVGFAKFYNYHRRRMANSRSLDHSSSDGIDQVIRRLAGISSLGHEPGEEPDWCAAFISVLSRIVDEEYPTFIQSRVWDSEDKSASFASARKLLRSFGKSRDSFLAANVEPIPGCIAIYTNVSWVKHNGHVGLVVSVDDRGQMETIEGNAAPGPGSLERGIFEKKRNWGGNQFIASGNEKLQYRGCVLPWSGMSRSREDLANVCTGAVNESTEKALGAFPGGSSDKMDRGSSKAGTIW